MKAIAKMLGLISVCNALSAGVMQDSGLKPMRRYVKFIAPVEALDIAKKYLPKNPTIIEAGAYDGNESCAMAQLWPKGHIYSFEPVPELYKKTIENTKNCRNITAYPYALGDFNGHAAIFLSNETWSHGEVSMSSSLMPPKEHLDYAPTKFEGNAIIQVVTMDAWAAANNIQKIDMLWLDMQGYELAAMKASPRILSTVSVILTELEFVEAYENQPLYAEVREWLESEGFILVAGNFTFPKDPGQWFGDGLFVRKELVKKRR